MKALVIGASGQVGGCLLTASAGAGGEALGVGFLHGNLPSVDLRQADAIHALVEACRPAVIFLPAALTNVDYCEMHPDECDAVNVQGVANVAQAAGRIGSGLVLFSTEHVFGDTDGEHAEDDPPAPRSAYARSKVAAEELVRKMLPGDHLILRTSWVYGPDPQRKNFLYRATTTLRHNDLLVVPEDQWGQPTYGPNLAEVAWELVRRGCRGTYHAVGPAFSTRLQFAQAIADAYGLERSLIRGQPTARLQQAAPRPLKPRLGRQKLLAELGRDGFWLPERALAAMRDGQGRPNNV